MSVPDLPHNLIDIQQEWHRTYEVLARRSRDSTVLRRRLLRLSTALMWHPAWGVGDGRGAQRVELCRQARRERETV
ncbi:hypothetical protein ACTWQF_34275 [Streptomyces sp. 8N114]|uniref:hypothetical protein n=1 Tax=Streptomyces sp. 8N114 TaxID=3457419 RepID=UPI003FD5BA8A